MSPDRLGTAVVAAATALVLGTSISTFVRRPAGPHRAQASAATSARESGHYFDRAADPARTVVRGADGRVVAVLTDGARTVRLSGPSRDFAEPRYTARHVRTNAWVRLLPRPWTQETRNAPWFVQWLADARADRSPDVLAVMAEYLHGAPARRDRHGVRVAGDAEYGPVSADDPDGRAENSDFYDYLGVPWRFPGGEVRAPARKRYGAADCSGFIRLVYGYRMGLSMRARGDRRPGELPRTSAAMASRAGGTVVARDRNGPPPLDQLQEGDLVLFDVDPDDPAPITHSGIYLGLDDEGRPRFVSSRTTANGPTFGDLGGAAVLDGPGHYARGLRVIRRL
ncbi:hypothetical protein GCM10010124_28480 [Pilimelia terevasa]|uniref:NlpC/P60 domain-containing protein n=1 Tax=Pilimelia terevasa TaxID=53372 RepID=A0A8J3FJN3_9ACTN|nr:NlpC/P60 family protein [Pilimelia terevasa]GGK34184.1 hypothetical protein GCM10010124_28480 [Pilimelia terevasa]